MISADVYNAIVSAVEYLENGEEIKKASWETLQVVDALARLQLNTQIDDRDQVIILMQTLQGILQFSQNLPHYIRETRAFISTYPPHFEQLDANTEVVMSADDAETNFALRDKLENTKIPVRRRSPQSKA